MRHDHLVVLAVVAIGGAALGFSVSAPTTPVQAAGATVTIPADMYAPAAITIEAGQTVTWINKDSDPHVTVSVPGDPEAFTLANYAGKSTSFKFTKPGVYVYYCLDHATYNATLHRVVARKESDLYPLAMEGLIVVKGPGFTGAPSATVRLSRGAYAPDIAVVRAGGKVTWTNSDTGAHAVVVKGAGVPKLDLAAGKSKTATFAKPGIYFFYDEGNAAYNPKLGLAAAKKGTPTFPVASQGYVIVL
ncbi:MAG TPA: plastocyanin/azurin family copper-binding protein [bacterium]|nr:plastocyanin/azurin family copper-binding protein [bacterium]